MPELDQQYFSVDHSMSWKEVAKTMESQNQQDHIDIQDGLAELSAQRDHGQLAVDIYQTNADVIVQAPIAGVAADDLELALHGDTLTIKGERKKQRHLGDAELLYGEVHWGTFSRSIILPVDIINDRVEATLEHGILSIRMPKANRTRTIKVVAKD